MEEKVFYSVEELKEYLNTIPKDVSVKITISGDTSSDYVIPDEKFDEINEAIQAWGGDPL